MGMKTNIYFLSVLLHHWATIVFTCWKFVVEKESFVLVNIYYSIVASFVPNMIR